MPTPMPAAKRPPKVQRWIDLVAALLRYHYPVGFDTLCEEVPAYRDPAKKRDAVLRMFERDKDELRALGVPIESVLNDDGVPDRYRLRARDFYLPYLSVVDDATPRRRTAGYSYRALPILAFLPDELELIVRAGQRVQQLGDPLLAHHAATALRKLAHDVAVAAGPSSELIAAEPPHDAALLATLDDAIRRRKRVTMAYHSIGRNHTGARTVEPLGLIFISSAWYLIANDPDADAVKQFRVRRITSATVHSARPQSPDFTAPAGFSLAPYATSRHPWELGDQDAVDAEVRFTGSSGAAEEARQLGQPVAAHPTHRRFRVRRPEAFARWLLALGGEAEPVAPAAVVTAWRTLAAQTAAHYAEDGMAPL